MKPSILFVIALAVAACPRMPEPDGCRPGETFCRDGRPHVCSQTQRSTPADRPCADIGAVCCRTRSPYGRELSACVPTDRCLPGGAQ